MIQIFFIWNGRYDCTEGGQGKGLTLKCEKVGLGR
jgi:hypothetical protein